MLALADENMGSHFGNVLSTFSYMLCEVETERFKKSVTHAKGNRGELVVLANGQRQHTLILDLIRVEQEILGIEAGTGSEDNVSQSYV